VPATITTIVEGHGEVVAVPILLRRISGLIDPTFPLYVPPPFRVPKARLLKDGELERSVELAARKAGPDGGIFILIDADESCPATLGPELLARAERVRGNFPISVVLAKWEFEAWFIAAAGSLAGTRGLPPDLTGPADPEAIVAAKQWLGQRMGGRPGAYSETIDQPAFTASFDIPAARAVDSFDKCFREVQKLLGVIRST
jgi:hypothetical protein